MEYTLENAAEKFQASWIGEKEKGACIKSGESLYIRAGGADIWGKKDECNFYFMPVVGELSIEARIRSFEKSDLYAKAALMIREDLDAKSPHVAFMAFPDNEKRHNNNGGCEFQYRLTRGGKSQAIYPSEHSSSSPRYPVQYPNVWLRLTRKEDCFTAYLSADGQSWKTYCEFTAPFPEKVLVGLAVCSHSKKKLTLAQFSDIKIEEIEE